MIFAPGNFSRESLFEKNDFHLLKYSLNALSRGVFVITFWLPSLAFILLLVSDVYKISLPSLDISKMSFLKSKRKIIALCLAFLFIVAFVGFFPSVYTTKWIPQRAYTPIFFVFTLFASIFIFVAIIKIKILNSLNKLLSDKAISPVLLLLVVVTLSHNSNVMNAYSDLTSGKAIAYNKQVKETYRMLEEAPSEGTIYVKELAKKPLILPIRWPAKHNRLANSIWEDYFNIERVELD